MRLRVDPFELPTEESAMKQVLDALPRGLSLKALRALEKELGVYLCTSSSLRSLQGPESIEVLDETEMFVGVISSKGARFLETELRDAIIVLFRETEKRIVEPHLPDLVGQDHCRHCDDHG